MAQLIEVHVPDIGDFTDVPVIEIVVSPGDRVEPETPLVTLESDKATMDVPSPAAGIVEEISVAVGDSVSEGTLLLTLKPANGADAGADEVSAADEPAPSAAADASSADAGEVDSSRDEAVVAVKVPDIGDFTDIPVIEVMVGPGDTIRPEDPLVTLESDKATMDVPSTLEGEVVEVAVTVGDTVSEGDLLLTVRAAGGTPGESETAKPQAPEPSAPEPRAPAAETPPARPATGTDPRAPLGRLSPTATISAEPGDSAPSSHATPAIRRYARELGVDLAEVRGTGRKGRITKDDVNGFVKSMLAAPRGQAGGSGIEPIPAVDFSKFGEIETRPLSRIKRISGPHLHRVWVNVPHVTNHDEVDITELEAFRQWVKEETAKQGVRLTLLAFVTKAVAATLGEFPNFNSSLSPDGESLIIKKYVNIGIAVDTPSGLMVPVLKDADRKGVADIARDMAELGEKARDGKLKPGDMQGGTFSISSLGGIGGTAFTPIINAPEVAILGLSRSRMAPVWDGRDFVPRLMQPLDLSWDHRVVDGAEAARFLVHLGRLLADVRRLVL